MPLYGNQVDFDQIPVKNFVPEKGTTPPASPVEGQMWFDETAKEIKVFRDGSWIVTGYSTIIPEVDQKLADQNTAIQTDITAINNQISVLDGDVNSALTAAQAAQATADGAIRTYYQAEPPWANGTTQPDTALGDLWYDSDNDQAHRWNGSVWQMIEDNSIAAALAAAENAHAAATTAQESADGKNTVWYATSAPAGSTHKVGDTWFDTDDGHKIHRWDGDSWEPATLGENAIANLAIKNAHIADATIEHGKIASLDIGKATVGTLDAQRIGASSITAKHLTIGTIGANRVPNGAFEDGLDAWSTSGLTFGTVETVSTNGPGGSGSFVAKLAHNATAGNLNLVTENTMYIPVTQDGTKPLWYSCRARADAAIPDGFIFRATWYDAAKALLSNTTVVNGGALTTSYQLFEAQVIPPVGAAFMRVTLINQRVSSTIYVDDVHLREIVGTVQLADDGITAEKLKADAITAKHTITGPLFQTNASANRGVKIVSSANGNYGQLVTYDSAGNATFVLNGQTGAVTMKGDITTGSTVQGAAISGGSVTGSTLQTAATGERVVIRPDGSAGLIEFYSADPNETAPGKIDAEGYTDEDSNERTGFRFVANTVTGKPTPSEFKIYQGGASTSGTFNAINQPSLEAGRNTNQAVADETWTTISWQETQAVVSYWGSPGQGSINKGFSNAWPKTQVQLGSGRRWLVESHARFESNTVGVRQMRVQVQIGIGSPWITVKYIGANPVGGGLSTPLDTLCLIDTLYGGVPLRVQVRQNSGASLPILGSPSQGEYATRLVITQL